MFVSNFYHRVWPLTEHFVGDIDEVATLPPALSAADVANLYAAGVNAGG